MADWVIASLVIAVTYVASVGFGFWLRGKIFGPQASVAAVHYVSINEEQAALIRKEIAAAVPSIAMHVVEQRRQASRRR
jgi:hypothetical protein